MEADDDVSDMNEDGMGMGISERPSDPMIEKKVRRNSVGPAGYVSLHSLALGRGVRPKFGEERINVSTVTTGRPTIRRYLKGVDLERGDWEELPNEITRKILSSLDPFERRRLSGVSREWQDGVPSMREFEERVLSKVFGKHFKSDPIRKGVTYGRDQTRRLYGYLVDMLRSSLEEFHLEGIRVLSDSDEESPQNRYEISIDANNPSGFFMRLRFDFTIRPFELTLNIYNHVEAKPIPDSIMRGYIYIRHVLKVFEKYSGMYGGTRIVLRIRDMDVQFLKQSHPLWKEYGSP